MRIGSAVALRVAGVVMVLGVVALWPGPRAGGQGEVAGADGPAVLYELTFPEPEHRWLQVEMTMGGLPAEPISMRMSTASPGRYARHAFAKNVFEVEAFDGSGNALDPVRSEMARWDVDGHDGTVRLRYRVFGDRVDGTYLGIDATHAHLNMPASLMWGAGLERRAATLRFEPPPGRDWQVATQLYPTDDPLTFTAPNLQYLLDSPAEFGDFAERTFTVADPADAGHTPRFRVALHHDGTDDELDRYAADVERIVRESVTVFGEFPVFETGRYTFIADYGSSASGDAMEHRNSTVLTSPGALARQHSRLLGSVAHEFFHVWNVERIRPRSLEPFDFEDVNPSGELWLAEGFTNYYGSLILQRAGLADLPDTLQGFVSAINTVRLGPGRRFRSAVDMSRLAPFTDAASAIDRTNWGNFFISYYTWGETLGLGLDLQLRVRGADGAVDDDAPTLTLDDYMQFLWERFGQAGGTEPGVVDRPYTLADARAALADLTGDQPFADDFFDRYVEGHDVIDYAPLFERAGLVLQPRAPGRGWLGSPSVRFDRGGARITAPVRFGSPLYDAGVERDDVLVSIDGQNLSSAGRLASTVENLDDGARATLVYTRDGESATTWVTVEADPTLELLALEQLGRRPTPAQQRFRNDWLGSKSGL
ncbi:MAG: PDZ domain-containing protein [Vicinamibacterales bacterium]|nr:PDZ domain-containing protein [Vicinamibacterales bacterium]